MKSVVLSFIATDVRLMFPAFITVSPDTEMSCNFLTRDKRIADVIEIYFGRVYNHHLHHAHRGVASRPCNLPTTNRLRGGYSHRAIPTASDAWDSFSRRNPLCYGGATTRSAKHRSK